MVHERINVTRSSMPGFDEYMEKLKTVWDSRWLSNRGDCLKTRIVERSAAIRLPHPQWGV